VFVLFDQAHHSVEFVFDSNQDSVYCRETEVHVKESE
jgi:hypothetical protein